MRNNIPIWPLAWQAIASVCSVVVTARYFSALIAVTLRAIACRATAFRATAFRAVTFKATLFGAIACGVNAWGQVEETAPLSPAEQLDKFHLPPGFEIQLVASEPSIAKPMNLAFDVRGRLWVSNSTEYPYAAPADRAPKDTLKVLSDFAANGRAQKIRTFADGLNIPMGVYPYRNGVVCFSIPNIWHLRDTDGDGRADQRDVLYGPFDTSRDTHGMCNAFRRGLDGWMYACHGFNNQSSVAGKDGNRVEMQSGNTFRFRLDGSRIEHFTNGQVNPFGMAFDRHGDIFTADCHTKPINLLLQGGHHDSFGKPHDGLGYIPNVLEHLHNSTGIGGIALGRGSSFPSEYQDTTFGGNVVTARINRNRLQYDGSSMRAIEQPDFLICDDPWFRPVDLVFGPDGALYVADFYNRIIGHYEVPLDHPGRDRFRGRIWRIVYRGDESRELAENEDQRDHFDLSGRTSSQLIAGLTTENVALASLVIDRLTDDALPTGVASVANRLRKVIYDSANGMQRANAFRALARLDVLDRADFEFAVNASDALLRMHAYRALASEKYQFAADLVLTGLADESPIVRRAAVQAAAVHSREEFIEPLFALYGRTPTSDRYLRHSIRIALRNLLRNDDWFGRLIASGQSLDDELMASVCMALKTPAAGEYVASRIDPQTELAMDALTERLEFVARYAAPATIAGLADMIQSRYKDDIRTQLSLLSAFREGAVARDAEIPPKVSEWATTIARDLLHVNAVSDGAPTQRLRWTFVPHNVGDQNPWVPSTKRDSEDEQSSLLLSSFPNGEQRTGTYRSTAFELRDTFRFHLAGHDGPPEQPLQGKNWVRLRDAESNDVLRAVNPPRSDVAQLVVWQLGENAGKRVYIELVDGDSGAAFAWLAAGRFSVAGLNPSHDDRDRRLAASVVSEFELKSLLPAVSEVLRSNSLDRKTMARLFGCVAQLNPASGQAAATKALVATPEMVGVTDELLERVRDFVVADEDVSANQTVAILQAVMEVATEDEQLAMAESLAAPAGADLLLGLIESGHMSARVVLAPVIQAKLAGLSDSQRARFAEVGDQLPTEDDAIAEKILELRQAYLSDGGRVAAGQRVFTEHCQVCHRIGNQGKQVGPNLDGIGNRGLYRLTEDIYTPSRNIDKGFVSTLIATADGQSHLGLLKDKDSPQWLLINLKGEEVRIAADAVEEWKPSRVSPMPGNFSTVLTVGDACDLLAFLLNGAD